MSETDRFDRFTPTTPTEMMLFNEIQRLRRVNHVLMRDKGVSPYMGFERREVVVDFEPPPVLRLELGASVLGQIDERGRLSVNARCYGKERGALGFAYYLTPQDMQDMPSIANILMHQHEQFIHAMADALLNEPEAKGAPV